MGTAKPPEVREAEVGILNHGTTQIVELVSLSLDHLRDTWPFAPTHGAVGTQRYDRVQRRVLRQDLALLSKVSRVSIFLCHWFDGDQSTNRSIQEPAYIDLKNFLYQAPRICFGSPRSGMEAGMSLSPNDVTMKTTESEKETPQADWDMEQREPEKKRSGVLNVVISGLALFSDGYNAQISE